MTTDDDHFREIKVTCVPQVETVRFYEETRQHVLSEHEEISRTFIRLPSFDDAVDKALSGPTHVEQSYNNSYVFVDKESTNRDGVPLRVPVKMIANSTSGYVKTVFFGTSEVEGRLVYQKAKS